MMSIAKRILDNLRNNNYNLFFKLICVLAASSLIFAYIVEYIFGFKPCILCLYERIPFFFLIMISCLGLIKPDMKRIWMILVKITFFGGAILTIYHVGVEHNIFNPTTTCSVEKNFAQNLSIDQMLHKINNAGLSDCRVPELKIFGFSMAELNMILNIFMFFFTMMVCKLRK